MMLVFPTAVLVMRLWCADQKQYTLLAVCHVGQMPWLCVAEGFSRLCRTVGRNPPAAAVWQVTQPASSRAAARALLPHGHQRVPATTASRQTGRRHI